MRCRPVFVATAKVPQRPASPSMPVLEPVGFGLVGDIDEYYVSDGLCPGVTVAEVEIVIVTHLSYLRFAILK